MKHASFILLALLVVRVATSAEAKSPPHEDRTILRRIFRSKILSLDPATCSDSTSYHFLSHFYEGLYGYHYLKRPVARVPLLAAEMPNISEDGLTYTIKIRKGLKYARNPCFGFKNMNELPVRFVKAADFVLAIKRCADMHVGHRLAWSYLSNHIKGLDEWREKTITYKPRDFSRYDLPVAGLQAVDDLTLRIKLTEKYPQFLDILSSLNYAPVPREAMDFWFLGKWAKPQSKALQPVFSFSHGELQLPGTGPYLLKTYCIGAPIVMVRNPNFRDERFPAEGGPGDKKAGLLNDAGKKVPFIKTIHCCYVPSSKEAWEMFLSGQIAATGVPKKMIKKVLTEKMLLNPKWKSKGIILDKSMRPYIYWIVFNLEDPVLGGSKSLRQAMCLAYDVQEHIRTLYDGRGNPAKTFIPGSFVEHEFAPSPYAKFDLLAAKKKIEQAKRELAAKGLLEDGRIPAIRLDIGGKDPDFVRLAEFAQKQFARIGLKIKPVFNHWPIFLDKIHKKQVQMYTMCWQADYPDAQNFLQLYYSPNIKKGMNKSNYSNPEYDKLYAKASIMFPSEERTKLNVQMLRILNEDCPALLLIEPITFTLRWEWLKNYKPHPFGYGYTRYLRIDNALLKKVGRKEVK